MAVEIPTLDEFKDAMRQIVREELERGRPEEMVSIEEAATRTGYSTATIRRGVKSGKIPATRLGARYRIPASALRPANEGQVLEFAYKARHGGRR